MYRRRGSSELTRSRNGEREQYVTPPATTIPVTTIPVVWEITALANTVYHLRQALLDGNPRLEGRIKELHTAWKDEVITIREYWEGLQELRLYSR